MADDTPRDPSTGLLLRAAFLREVRDTQQQAPTGARRGCLLTLHFPGLSDIARIEGTEAADQNLKFLLAIIESRLRSRDTLGRIGDHSLCLLLRQCREGDAIVIAEQYMTLLGDGVLDHSTHRAVTGMHYRVVPLDSRGNRPRQNVSPKTAARSLSETAKLLAAISSLSQSVKPDLASVSSIDHLDNKVKPATPVGQGTTEHAQPSAKSGRSHSMTQDGTGNSPSRISWRLKPGLLVSHNKPLVCCYRVQQVGFYPVAQSLPENPLLNRVLRALALDSGTARPVIESQLVIPVDASQLNSVTALWLKDQCRIMRVSPSDICFAVTLASVSAHLRECMPTLRLLNRQGIRLMLEGVSSVSQFSALQLLAGFDYVWISAKMLQGSLHDKQQRQVLHDLVGAARQQNREVCANGIDTLVMLQHAKSLGVDIGFGRACGKSVPFPVL